MRTFIDFIQSEHANNTQFMSVVQNLDPESMKAWFEYNGYEVSSWECARVIETYQSESEFAV
ncbi:hypothetical protein EHQ53_13795 [Leptospira langatensis]|uniref:Nif11 family protein n=1 Tax=Leptospira langatensis TaxID=2484983 RepID=A0A5F1ZTQ3_9LEPT|nr:hypothetical protein [Leptospira langatensis]TGK02563.1 hypothetical protein EHO57_04320 [Leptospira langatensis]TGL40236.1 hypothetical protein EHQ53_13795 [Leptospira langatensis]